MVEKLGQIGIGAIGRPIAENFLQKGVPLVVYDIKERVREEMRAQGAEVTQSSAEVAKKSQIILLLVNNSNDVKNVLFGQDGLLKGASKGTIVVDMTTSEPKFSKKWARRLLTKGIEYLDAPLTGGVLGAKTSQLLIMVGGKREIYERCLPVFSIISKRAIFMGETGRGHLMKLIHNQLSHATFLAACEAVTLGERLGLSMNDMMEVFNLGNARSYATEIRFPKFIIPGTYNMGGTFFTTYKDISIVRKLGNKAGLRLPINDATYRYWKYPVDKGEGEEDWSRIISKMKDILLKK